MRAHAAGIKLRCLGVRRYGSERFEKKMTEVVKKLDPMLYSCAYLGNHPPRIEDGCIEGIFARCIAN